MPFLCHLSNVSTSSLCFIFDLTAICIIDHFKKSAGVCNAFLLIEQPVFIKHDFQSNTSLRWQDVNVDATSNWTGGRNGKTIKTLTECK